HLMPRVRSRVTVSGDRCNSSAISFSERPFSLYSMALFAIEFTSFMRSPTPRRTMRDAGYQDIGLARGLFQNPLRCSRLQSDLLQPSQFVDSWSKFLGGTSSAANPSAGSLSWKPASLEPWRAASRRNPAAALVPPELAELFESFELFGGEDGTIQANELVVQRACVADPDPALHVPFEARLNRDLALLREAHDALHHPLRTASEDLVELL